MKVEVKFNRLDLLALIERAARDKFMIPGSWSQGEVEFTINGETLSAVVRLKSPDHAKYDD